MRYLSWLLLMTILTGCVVPQKTEIPNKTPSYLSEIVADTTEELQLLYPPAKTRFVLLGNDAFCKDLIQTLRSAGYSVNESRGNGITIGYVLDHPASGDVLIKLYIGDDVMLSRLYRLNPPGYEKKCFAVGAWSRRQMATNTDEGQQ